MCLQTMYTFVSYDVVDTLKLITNVVLVTEK